MEASALRAPACRSRISVGTPLLRLRTDEQLVAHFRSGSEDAFQVIYDRYRQRIFAYTRQMLGGSRSDAEDALQDVFLRAYGALRADDRALTLRAWLYRVAHNRCIDQIRRPVPAPADIFEVSRSALHDPLVEAQRRDDLRRLVADIARLPHQQRSALLMREMEGLTYAELSAALAVSVPAVKSLLVRARIGLVEAVEARDAACGDIRSELAIAHDRGVRASGRSRRHLHECDGCRQYRGQLRGVGHGLSALNPPAGPLTALANLLGLGGSGAAAGGGVVAAGGGVTASKVAAIVAVAVVTGSATEVRKQIVPATPTPAHAAPRAATPAPAVAAAPPGTTTITTLRASATVEHKPVTDHVKPARSAPPVVLGIPVDDPTGQTIRRTEDDGPAGTVPDASGGVLAPDEDAAASGDLSADPSSPTDAGQPGTTSLASPAPGAGTGTPGSGSAATAPLGPGSVTPAGPGASAEEAGAPASSGSR